MKTPVKQALNASFFHLCTTLVFLVLSISNLSVSSLSTGKQSIKSLNPIQKENQLPGTSDWQLTNPAQEDNTIFHYPAIEGYAWATSIQVGDAIKLSVSTTASSFSADVYRMGWYQGKGGRLIQSLIDIPGHSYPVPSLEADTGLIEAKWPVAFTLQTNAQWVSGMYMIKLTELGGQQSYIPFVLRSSQPSNFAFIHAVNTDEAYNFWGGTSLYNDFTHKLKAKRAFKVSFDRPFEQDNGAGLFFWFEYPMVRWLEQQNYDVSYFADPDLQSMPPTLKDFHALIIAGHSEYWSKQMRGNLESVVNQGVNLAVFAANSIYWQIRYEARRSDGSSIPNRIIVCYKSKALDPLYSTANSAENTSVTVKFRDEPIDNSEQPLLGSMWAGQWEPRKGGYSWVVADASNWVFAGTRLKNGDNLPGLIGYEYDKVDTGYPVPPGVDILSSSPVVSDITHGQDISNSTLYTATSGARVFNAGTFEWSWGLDNNSSIEKDWSPGNNSPHPSLVNKAAQRITSNILQNFLRKGSSTPKVSNDSGFNLQRFLPYAVVLFTLLYLVFCYWAWRRVSVNAKAKQAQTK